METASQAAEKITELTGNNNVIAKKIDLSSLKSVRLFAKSINEEEERVDLLINNAGMTGGVTLLSLLLLLHSLIRVSVVVLMKF